MTLEICNKGGKKSRGMDVLSKFLKKIAFVVLFIISEIATGRCDPQIEVVNRDFLWETYIEQIVCKIKSTSYFLSPQRIVLHHPVSAKERVRFLNRDFKTKAFNLYNIVSATDFIAVENQANAVHFGIIEVGFNRCPDLDRAYNIVIKANRKNFRVEVLTIFTVLRRSHNLIFLYSETPDAHPDIQFMKEIEDFAIEKKECQP